MAGFNPDDYEPVADRIAAFWKTHPKGRIATELLTDPGDLATVVIVAAVYRDIADAHPAATGYAFERAGEGMVNKTAHLENGETSAIGRALANLGYSTKHRASREEMEKVARGEEKPAAKAEEKGAETGGSEEPVTPEELRKRIKDRLLLMSGIHSKADATEERLTLAGDILEELTKWTTKEGEEKPGKRELDKLTEKQLPVVYGKVKTAFMRFEDTGELPLPGGGAVEDDQEIPF